MISQRARYASNALFVLGRAGKGTEMQIRDIAAAGNRGCRVLSPPFTSLPHGLTRFIEPDNADAA